mgnify:CR=1 FL=1
MNNDSQELAAFMQFMNQDSGLGDLAQLMQMQSGMAQEQRAQDMHPLQMQGAEQALMMALAQQQAGEQQQVFDNQFAQDNFGFAQDQFGLMEDQYTQDIAAEQRLNAFRQQEADRNERALGLQEGAAEPMNALRVAQAAQYWDTIKRGNIGLGQESEIPPALDTKELRGYFQARSQPLPNN